MLSSWFFYMKWRWQIFRLSDVIGRRPLALASWQGEGGFTLRLGEAAGQLGEGLDERVALGDGHLPQLHFLTSRPLLGRLLVHLPMLPEVCLVPQHNDRHLRAHTHTHMQHIKWTAWRKHTPSLKTTKILLLGNNHVYLHLVKFTFLYQLLNLSVTKMLLYQLKQVKILGWILIIQFN